VPSGKTARDLGCARVSGARVNHAPWSRREWLRTCAAGGALASALPMMAGRTGAVRSFHVCLSPAIVANDPELVAILRDAGVGTVWLAGYFYGHRPYPDELIAQARARLRRAGIAAGLITVPLGHPGDSLGARDGDFPLTPPPHWRTGERPDGQVFAGTSLHLPATKENPASAVASWTMTSASRAARGRSAVASAPITASASSGRAVSVRPGGTNCWTMCTPAGSRRFCAPGWTSPAMSSPLHFTRSVAPSGGISASW
jgi:hypothetical protein